MTRSDFSPILAAGHSPIVPFRTTGAGSPLFCLPGGGGNVHIFDEMTAALPEGQPVYAIDMEPLSDAAREFTIEQLAVFYLEIIRGMQASGPYYFCGYSFGGFIAYEMALQLIEEGDGGSLVALLDAPNPAMLSNLSQTDAAQFHKTYLTDRIKRYALQLKRGDIKAFTERGSTFIVNRLGKFFTPLVKKGFRVIKRPLPKMFRHNDPVFLNAIRSYIPKPYAKSVVLFRVEDRGPEYARDPSMGWDACVQGGVEVHIVPGGHVDMMRMPSVGVLAAKLAAYLDNGSDLNR